MGSLLAGSVKAKLNANIFQGGKLAKYLHIIHPVLISMALDIPKLPADD